VRVKDEYVTDTTTEQTRQVKIRGRSMFCVGFEIDFHFQLTEVLSASEKLTNTSGSLRKILQEIMRKRREI
jgi:hypothetical protein